MRWFESSRPSTASMRDCRIAQTGSLHFGGICLEPTKRLAEVVKGKLSRIGFRTPGVAVINKVLETLYFTSLKTEEARPVRCSVTFADPRNPEPDPPLLRRADYPSFNKLGKRLPLTVENLTKLSRAIDYWAASIAIHGSSKDLKIWGVVDQMVHQNTWFNRENEGGAALGIFTAVIDGIGEISAYHDSLLLGALRANEIIIAESPALDSSAVVDRIWELMEARARDISTNLPPSIVDIDDLVTELSIAWTDMIARLCIGIQRLRSGGTLLITPSPVESALATKYPFRYSALAEAFILAELEWRYTEYLHDAITSRDKDDVSVIEVLDEYLARSDSDDRALQLTGAVRLISSLASADGVVLLNPDLSVLGFGTKIISDKKIGAVYRGEDLERKVLNPRKVDPTAYGTRHTSVMRYCKLDQNAIGIIISQDAHVRLVASHGSKLAFFDNVKLREYGTNVSAYRKWLSDRRKWLGETDEKPQVGYTPSPKTVKALAAMQFEAGRWRRRR